MLEMVPELLIQKQLSEITDVATMEKKEDQEYSTVASASEATDSQASNNKPDTAINSSENPLVSILSTSLKNKVVNLLQKTNLTETELLKRVQLIKRKTKDKRKPSQVHRIFSQKNSAGCYFSSTKRLKRQKQLRNCKSAKRTDVESSTSGSVTSELEEDLKPKSVVSLLEKDCTQSGTKIKDTCEDYQVNEETLENTFQDSKVVLFSSLKKNTDINTDIKKSVDVKQNRIIKAGSTNNSMGASFEDIKRNNNDIKLNIITTIDLTEDEEIIHSNTVNLIEDIDDILDELKDDLFQVTGDSTSSTIAEPSKSPALPESINTNDEIEDESKKSCTQIEEKRKVISVIEEIESVLVDNSISDEKTDNKNSNEDILDECVLKNEQQLKGNEDETIKQVINNDNYTKKKKIEDQDSSNEENSNNIEDITIQCDDANHENATEDVHNDENNKFQELAMELTNTGDTKEEDVKKDDIVFSQVEIEEMVNKNSIPSEENDAFPEPAIELNNEVVHMEEAKEEETNLNQAAVNEKINKNSTPPVEKHENFEELAIDLNNKIGHTEDIKEKAKKYGTPNQAEIEEKTNQDSILSDDNDASQEPAIELNNKIVHIENTNPEETNLPQADTETKNNISIPFEENDPSQESALEQNNKIIHIEDTKEDIGKKDDIIFSQVEIKERISSKENDESDELAVELKIKIVHAEDIKEEVKKCSTIFCQAEIEKNTNKNSISSEGNDKSQEPLIELNNKIVRTEDTNEEANKKANIFSRTEIDEKANKNHILCKENDKSPEPTIELINKMVHTEDSKDEANKNPIFCQVEIENKNSTPFEGNNKSQEHAVERNNKIVLTRDTKEKTKKDGTSNQVKIEENINKHPILSEENNISQKLTTELSNKIVHTEDIKEIMKKGATNYSPSEIEEELNKKPIPFEENDKPQECVMELNNKIVHEHGQTEIKNEVKKLAEKSISSEASIYEEKSVEEESKILVQKDTHEENEEPIKHFEVLQDIHMKNIDPNLSITSLTTEVPKNDEKLFENEDPREVFEMEEITYRNSEEMVEIQKIQEKEIDINLLQSEEKRNLENGEVDKNEIKIDDEQFALKKDITSFIETKETEVLEINTDTVEKEDTDSPAIVASLPESSEKIQNELQNLLVSDTNSQNFQNCTNDSVEGSRDIETKTTDFISLPSTSAVHIEEKEEEETNEECNFNIYSTLYGDDDIRNKIKEQLQLLRQVNRRPSLLYKEESASSSQSISCFMDDLDKPSTSKYVSPHVNIDDQPSISKTSLIRIEDDVLPSTSTSDKELQEDSSTIVPVTKKEDLKEVLLSNDGELMIVNVIGGYVSDHDDNIESVTEVIEKPAVIVTGQKSKKISITEKLLIELSQDNFHCIKPTKTTDITKIKGWRSKQFNVIDEESELAEKNIEQGEEILQLSVANTETTINSIENPIPGTSSNYLPIPVVAEIISKPTGSSSIKSDNILKQGEKQNEEKNKKSAFVSDELETFLNNNRKLNISYEIPKLVAEEAISKPKSEMPLSNNNYLEVVEKSIYKPKVSKKGKPKTLAEKRRMLELDRKMQLMHDMSVREDVYLKELAYCQKRNLTGMAEDIRDVLVTEEIPISRTCWMMAMNNANHCKQFILVNGKRIRIAGSAGGDDIIEPKLFPKHRLCNIDERKMCDTSKYKPGPLSRKHKLLKPVVQRNWESHLLKMPRIKLEVYPEYKKPLPLVAQQYLQLCRADNFAISKDWAQLAVTAVQTSKKTPRKKFVYELPYARNQNKLLVRKPALKRPVIPVKKSNMVKLPNKFAHIDVEDSIKQIMDDMITCVENQALDKRILKDDPDLRETLSEDINKFNKPSSPVHDSLLHHTIIKRPNIKRNRSTLELRRLNVQVIEVDVKDDESIPDNCEKAYCKLGCICKSLRGSRSGVPEHCGRESCMFKCNCSFDTLPKGHHSITLPAGTDILSASTMVRLQDEAKKNLAKVEREFTQTVIKANNQTIMVGGGTRDRTRRIPKVPKKFSNFTVGAGRGLNGELDDISPEKVQEKIINRNSTSESDTTRSPETKKLIPIWNKTKGTTMMKRKLKQPTKCFVSLEKLNLKHAIPWCMVHSLYKCYCNGKALPEVQKTEPVQKPVEESSKKSEDGEYITYNPRFSNRPAEPSVEHTDKYCARTKAIPSNLYQTRNKSEVFKEKCAKMAKQLRKHKLRSSETSDDEWLPIALPKKLRDDSNSSEAVFVEQNLLVPMKKKPRRHRTLIVDPAPYSVPLQEKDPLALPEVEKNEDHSISAEEQVLPSEEQPLPSEAQPLPSEEQPIKSYNAVELSREGSHIISSTTLIDYDKSYSGFITPSEDFVKHFYKMLDLNEHSKIHQIRLLEWQTMATRHKLGFLQVWFNTKRYNNIILTENRKRPSPSHMNIKHFNKITSSKFKLPDIISSLLKNTLPGKALEPTETYTIILFDGVHWEARGTIVLSESENICRKRLLNKPTPPLLSLHKQVHKTRTFNLVSTPAMSIELINNEGDTIPMNSESDENEITNNLIAPPSLHLPLPIEPEYTKWFSLILTNNFYSLRITFSNLTIKYTGLEETVAKAYKQNRTVMLKAPAENYNGVAENYGIYGVPGFRDRVFFGPYNQPFAHGLETFRYVNGKLVNTKYYHKITGNYNKILGSWFELTSAAPTYSDISKCVELYSNPELSPEIITAIDNPIQSDFVDLTENDDYDNHSEKSSSSSVHEKIDPLLTVLAADLSKKVIGPVTITPVEEVKTKKLAPLPKKMSTGVRKSDRSLKRKSEEDPLAIPEPAKKIKLIDSINLEDDDQEMPVLQPFNNEHSTQSSSKNNKQMPVLTALDPKDDEMSKKRLYVITNIPGVGYFELSFRKRNEKRKVLCITILGVSSLYPTINSAIQSLHHVFKEKMFFMPNDLKVKFSIVDSTEPPQMAKFSDLFLDGYYMISERGIFNVLYLTTADLECSEFSKEDLRNLMAHKCDLLVRKNINVLGSYLFQPKELKSMNRDDILDLAPIRIKKLEKDEQEYREQKVDLNNKQQMLINKINCLLRDRADTVREVTQHNVWEILRNNPDKTSNSLTQNKNSETSKPASDLPIVANFQNASTSDRNRTTLTNISTKKTVVLTDEINRTLIAKASLSSSPVVKTPVQTSSSPVVITSIVQPTSSPFVRKSSGKNPVSSSVIKPPAKTSLIKTSSRKTSTSPMVITPVQTSSISGTNALSSFVIKSSVETSAFPNKKSSSSAVKIPSLQSSYFRKNSLSPLVKASSVKTPVTSLVRKPSGKNSLSVVKTSSIQTPSSSGSNSTSSLSRIPSVKICIPSKTSSAKTCSSSGKISSSTTAQNMITGSTVNLQQCKSLPAGKYCKIIDGKILVLDKPGPPNRTSSGVHSVKLNSSPQNKTELLVPISGLSSPVAVTVPSEPTKKTTNILPKLPSSILIKKCTPVVDLTDD